MELTIPQQEIKDRIANSKQLANDIFNNIDKLFDEVWEIEWALKTEKNILSEETYKLAEKNKPKPIRKPRAKKPATAQETV